jgi:hypothetical protein
LTDEQDDSRLPDRRLTRRGSAQGRPLPYPRSPDQPGDDTSEEERASPFPYADNFEEWVEDETASEAGQQRDF